MAAKYVSIWSERRSLINTESHIRQYVFERDIFGTSNRSSLICAKNGTPEEFHLQQENQEWIKMGESLLDKAFFDDLLVKGKKLRTEFESFLKKINSGDLTRLSVDKLTTVFVQSCHYHSRLRAFFKTTRPEFISRAESELKLILKKSNESQKEFEILTLPVEMDGINLEFIDWCHVLDKEPIKQALIKHIQKYPWLAAHTYDKTEIYTYLLEKFNQDKAKSDKLKRELANLLSSKKLLLEKQTEILSKYNNPRLNYLSWLFQEASLERMRLKGGWAGSDFLYLPIYSEISRRTKVPLKLLYSVYRIDEVVVVLKNGIQLSVKEIEKRKIAYVLWLKENEVNFYSGPDASEVINQELAQGKDLKNTRLSGQIARRGKASGRVRVVIPGNLTDLKKSFDAFKKGEILVTTMTQPNMVTIMKKAAAVITDEGGLTSHAAIIAREFGIPCIVGTKRGTKVLKNGDLVEVDANKGEINLKI